MVKPVSVLVVDDSAFMRKYISDILVSDKRIIIAGTARNGKEAIDKINQLRPDVVTMDVEMPVLDGLEAVKLIMSQCPVPVIMLSSTTKIGADNTIQAMSCGAVDFIQKPSGAISLNLHEIQDDLIEKVLMASKAMLHNHLGQERSQTDNVIRAPKIIQSSKQMKPVILIGTSTGGPRALQTVLAELPGSINAPALVVQHMPPGFTASLAQRLDSLSPLKIKEAEHKEVLQNGTVYIAPGGSHLRIREDSGELVALLDQEPPELGHRPSVNVLFESAVQLPSYRKIAVIMTGMGSDGTEGVTALKKSGHTEVIAESEESCVVYGMPKSAILAGQADEIHHVKDIAKAIVKLI
ncbi:chemotaxis response regulator protein-glutamate methylesterase [Fictibacillus aquaticus]|uniref:Protein-glutamate methylesterase/protein-glutamine glutaminase n=1 Tax=Fictibacillus aquaticus TaxID=2021314 RepID=A0A235FBX0_9BACL|nr:chemotaxis response regulator protein-glutamate methylesterase [Fictibacillus aquaticus]OYD58838.1 chemotaxis response regulator protein-glutamate methylesterase [Fictibacillus aquaticus]